MVPRLLPTVLVAGLVLAMSGVTIASGPLRASGAAAAPSGTLRAASYVDRSPIEISGDSGFTPANGVTGGSGTAADPYIISGWRINCSMGDGLKIHDTRRWFVLQDLEIYQGPLWASSTGTTAVNLTRVQDGKLVALVITNASSGVFIMNSTGVSLQDSEVSIVGLDALYIGGSTNVLVSASHLDNAVAYRSAQVQMSGNVISGDVLVSSSDHVSLVGNVIPHPPNVYNYYYGTIELLYSTNVTLQGNIVTRGGIVMDGDAAAEFDTHTITPDNLVSGKPVRYYSNCHDLVISGVATGELIIASCVNVHASSLEFNDTDAGAELAFVTNATLEKTNVTSGMLYGLYVRLSKNVTVVGSSISDTRFGLVLWGTTGAVVYHNDFLRDTYVVYDDEIGSNRWDNGYPAGGNYWDAYRGVDNCSGARQDVCGTPDGIGDTPYRILADGFMFQGVDYYPLIQSVYPVAAPSTPQASPADGVLLALIVLGVVGALSVFAVAVILVSKGRRVDDSGPPLPPDFPRP